MKNSLKRRSFVKGLISMATVVCMGKLGFSSNYLEDDILNKSLLINPAYKAYIDSDGDLILETFLSNGTKWFIKCDELGKDIIQIIHRGKNIRENVSEITEKHHLTEKIAVAECTSILKKLYKNGVLIESGSKIIIVENVIDETDKK